MSKQVKITGIRLNKQQGILQACTLNFDEENRLIVIKGAVGQGKTQMQKYIELGVKGSKTLTDKKLYGEIDQEVQLVDGEVPIFVGCKSNETGLTYTLYTKDIDGKIVREPVIDGVKATPSKYLETLQTALTWRMDELISENPTVQKKILLELYQFELKKHGVIFDSKASEYKLSILGKIEDAERVRDEKDMIRKQKGGILEDLKAKGIDPDRPATVPDFTNLELIEADLKELERQKTIKETKHETAKKDALAALDAKAKDLVNEGLMFNESQGKKLTTLFNEVAVFNKVQRIRSENIQKAKNAYGELLLIGYGGFEVTLFIETLPVPEQEKPEPAVELIQFTDGKFADVIYEDAEAVELSSKVDQLRKDYQKVFAEPNLPVDTTDIDMLISQKQQEIESAKKTNLIVEAVDSFHSWRVANNDVLKLKDEYVKTLMKIDTGVEGLKIVPENENIYLMYNGCYDPTYFHNLDGEYRKVSTYSGTQKPIICLLIQSYLLNLKPKALRYMFIDNVPIDNKTRSLLELMCEKLDLHIFLNITGDFEHNQIQNGEILIEGGEVFFNE